MAFDPSSLEPQIYQILSAPGTDLTTISAKRVRHLLVEQDPSLTTELLKAHKEDVGAIIAAVFDRVSRTEGIETEEDDAKPRTERKRKKDEDVEGEREEGQDDADGDAGLSRKKAKKGAKNGRQLSDAELARKLSTEINSRPLRTSWKGRGSSNGTPRKSRSKKSAVTVDSGESDGDTPKTSGKKKAPTTKEKTAKGGFGKEYALSDPLAALLQVDKLSRPQVVKQLWIYIKEKELQNPMNKREILCDSSLKAIFAVDKIDMFKMNRVLGQHLHENE